MRVLFFVNRSDEALLIAYQKGEGQALCLLMQRYEKRLWNFVRRFVADHATAEDLLQDVFVRVLRNANEWQPRAKVSTWLFTIARNLCTDQARRMSVRKARSLDENSGDDERPLGEKIASHDGGAEEALLRRESSTEIEAALGQLPDEQREVFLMREVLDMSFAEIAAAVGASEPTVKSRMRYALEKLRDALTVAEPVVAQASESEKRL